MTLINDVTCKLCLNYNFNYLHLGLNYSYITPVIALSCPGFGNRTMMIIYSTSESGSTICWNELSTSDSEESDASWDGLEYEQYSSYMELALQMHIYKRGHAKCPG